MKHNYVGYHSDAGYALLSLAESVGKQRAVIGPVHPDGRIDFYRITETVFNKTFIKCMNGRNLECEPRVIAAKLLALGRPVTKSAIGHIEGALEMDTRGKSTEQIRAEVERLSADLPKGHALRDVPKFQDRGAAIAALTAVRQAIFTKTTKEKDMAGAKKAAEPKAKPTKGGTTEEAKKPSKAKISKPEAEPKADKKAEAAPKKEKKERKARAELVGPFKLAGEAAEAKSPEELKLHEGSARFQLVQHLIANGAKKAKGFSIEELTAVTGDQTKQALATLVKRGVIASV